MKTFALLFLLISLSSCLFQKKLPTVCINNRLSNDCSFINKFTVKVHAFKEHKDNILYFTNIKKIEMFNRSIFLKIKSLPKEILPLNRKGRFKLEVLIHSWKEKKHNVYMVQYSFIDIKSKNLVFENAQTIYVNLTSKK